ncbi:Glycosyltransferase involved in cell wall bisynthesis [Alkalispirochaeta americana]|uniref:Glycosyltransferase involved in cell wall bisynthesis n=1 Tax=Alkalispirochaeta americana TaxID=159291 RepID=A0A1N6RSP7_9SPIO|nr:glycosyltransferase [Alkalispirochaeta americana]SIQ31809.1 Glycosyltransferase involved in cell wall bisynthesis [Alkalispirochaeta americana]
MTICFENPSELKSTLQSVSSIYNASFMEQIVIDGSKSGSCDAVIDENQWIDIVVRELDAGKFDAMNKGVRVATGRYILFLNSGDTLVECAREQFRGIMDRLDAETKPVLFYGGVVFQVGTRLFLSVPPDPYFLKRGRSRHLPSHQATFYPKEFLLEYQYEPTYTSAADTAVAIEAIRLLPVISLCVPIAIFRLGGISNVQPHFHDLFKHQEEWCRARKVRGIRRIRYIGKSVAKFFIMKVIGWQRYYYFSLRVKPWRFRLLQEVLKVKDDR